MNQNPYFGLLNDRRTMLKACEYQIRTQKLAAGLAPNKFAVNSGQDLLHPREIIRRFDGVPAFGGHFVPLTRVNPLFRGAKRNVWEPRLRYRKDFN